MLSLSSTKLLEEPKTSSKTIISILQKPSDKRTPEEVEHLVELI